MSTPVAQQEPPRTLIEQIRELIAQYGDQLCLVVNHSGGKDRSRLSAYLKASIPTCFVVIGVEV